KMAMRMALGTARFASGRLGMVNKSNIDIQTPTASIAVRGTDFTTTIDELGRSLVILLPDQYGNPSGTIEVSNLGGTITLEEAYAATMVSTLDDPPTRQINISNITANVIDNMFIVSPPPEVKRALEEEFNELEYDALAEDELEFSELDIDFLNVDFLVDLLNVIDDLVKTTASLDDSAVSNNAMGAELKGAEFGLDADSQYNIYEDNGKIIFYRLANGKIQLAFAVDASVKVNTEVEGYSGIIDLNGGNTSSVIIRQGG
ncbi:MAG: hypothetical protein ACO3UU_12485, partial [Minisyncoccia bacterium]